MKAVVKNLKEMALSMDCASEVNQDRLRSWSEDLRTYAAEVPELQTTAVHAIADELWDHYAAPSALLIGWAHRLREIAATLPTTAH